MRTLAPSLRLLVPLVGCCVLACSVDERHLEGLSVVVLPNGGDDGSGATGGSGGDNDAGSGATGGSVGGSAAGGGGFGAFAGNAPFAGAGGTGSEPFGGAGGAPAMGGTSGFAGGSGTPGRCPDLDDNGVLDCDESLAQNPSFDKDATRWTPDPDITLAWDSTDATGNPESGSLASTATVMQPQMGSKLVYAQQCVPLTGGHVYEFAVQAFVQDDGNNAHAALQLVLFSGPSCSGDQVDDKTSNYVGGAAWSVAALNYLTPAVARSVSVRLVTIKAFDAPPATVLFDDVLVRAD